MSGKVEDKGGKSIGRSIERDVSNFEHKVAFSAFRRVSCFSHTLQLVVHQLDFDTMTMFKSFCGKKLIRDCPTRWSSTFLLIKHLLEVKNSLISVLHELEWDRFATSE